MTALVALRNYFFAVIDDGDVINDYLTYLPNHEVIRETVIGLGIILHRIIESLV